MSGKEFAFLLWAIVPAAICAGAGAYMAINEIGGWGWLLFAAMVLYPNKFRTGKAAELDAQRELEESRRGGKP